ncbi:hypothetical protein [Bradyrhizobium sp. BR 10289]|uniref:hypothetical protein n=1 Tax=Bradyrhizobium sp. BR 10289 TaxID=2749993 RepID=UPI001C64EC56|nr:hypothetical protein [Bradyrhizobium sp. BR 10289]MBW7974383.1 hypothetical protein [Bradyrhizobium sp. BR 10289]
MPIFRYFLIVGSALLTLLLALDACLPRPDEPVEHADVDRTIIRIHSIGNLPEKIVFDTSSPALMSPNVLTAERPEPGNAFAMTSEPAPSAPRATAPEPAPPRKVRHQSAQWQHSVRRQPQRRLAFDQHDIARW